MEKMTVSMFAVLHGDDEALGETETWGAETREELAHRYVAFLRSVADAIEAEIPKPASA
jgi:hypothetical protein